MVHSAIARSPAIAAVAGPVTLRSLATAAVVALLALAMPATAGPGELLVLLRDAADGERTGAAPSPGDSTAQGFAAAQPLSPALLLARLEQVLAPHLAASFLAGAEARPLLPARAAPHRLNAVAAESRDRLARTYVLRLAPGADSESLVAALDRLGEVERVTLNHSIAFAPVATDSEWPLAPSALAPSAPARSAPAQSDDPLRIEQWYLDRVGVEEAWAVTRGRPEIIIAFIDTGVFSHADLIDNLWVNDDPPGNASPADDGFDQDGSGAVEDWEKADDDDNGYVDDLNGYDFVDAPRIGGPGDAVERDNDVTDDSGHGTAVAGLIGASVDNGLGISGLAPGCRLMPVRAGFNPGLGEFSGVLEEDDAAAAIVYAAENGAAVINMSWGDTLLPPVIGDAIEYARALGSLLVASAGNSRFDGMHYPSGLAPVLAVGASNVDDARSSFSNFGPALDLLAPGSSLLTTVVRNGQDDYLRLSGTSFAAPLVSAAAALLLSRDPGLAPLEVASVLFSTTRDLASPGYDLDSGHGRLAAGRALAVSRAATLAIHSPGGPVGVDRMAPLVITAEGLRLESYRLELGEGRNPASFTLLAGATGRQAVVDTVATWQAGDLPAGEYTLRLRAQDALEGALEERTLVSVDHTAPLIENLVALPLWVEDRLIPFVFFATDDLARGAIELPDGGGGGGGRRLDGSFLARDHVLRLPEDLAAGSYRLEVVATNTAGLAASAPELEVRVSGERARTHALDETALRLPGGELAPRPLDLNGNGARDLVVMAEVPGRPFGPLVIYESAGDDAYVESAVLADSLLPRDLGDSDGDGRMEILASGAATACLLESPAPDEYPTDTVWSDSGGFAIGFAQLSGAPVILGIKSDSLLVYRSTGDASAWTRTAFANFTGGVRSLSPSFFTGDIDGDGATEVVVGDAGGDLIAFREVGGTLVPAYSLALSVDGNPLIAGGDLDGDGQPEVVVDLAADLNVGSEALLERRRHLLLVFTADPAQGFSIGPSGGSGVTGLAVAGAEPRANALRVVSVDADPQAEILLVAAPDFYLFELETPAEFSPTYYRGEVRSASLAVGDGDGDGRVEIFARSGVELLTFEARDPALPGPLPPDGLAARIVVGGAIDLSWNPGASTYRIYRAPGSTVDCDIAQLLAEVNAPAYLDTTAGGLAEVTYRVSAVEAMVESECSRSLTLVRGDAPALLSVVAEQTRAVRVTFSTPMGVSADRLENYRIFGPGEEPVAVSSVISTGGERERLLVLGRGLEQAGEHRLEVGLVRSLDGVPLAGGDRITFSVADGLLSLPLLYLESAGASAGEVALSLSVPPDATLGADPASYLLSGGFTITGARIADRQVNLSLDPSAPLGPGIFRVRLAPTLRGARGEVVVEGQGDAIEFVVGGEIVAFPNPYDAGRAASDGVNLVGLSPGDQVILLDALGREILRVNATIGGSAFIPVRGNLELASGIYLYQVLGAGGETSLGRLAITH